MSGDATIKAAFVELSVVLAAVMAVMGLLRFGFAMRFWRRVRLAGYVYVLAILCFALVQLIFHVRL